MRRDRYEVVAAVPAAAKRPIIGYLAPCRRRKGRETNVSDPQRPPKGASVPPPQENLQLAAQRAFEMLGSQSHQQLRWLGAQRSAGAWRLPVLGDVLDVDLSARRIVAPSGDQVGLRWSILVLHYLAVTARPEQMGPSVTFADLGTARSYAGVYAARVNERLCHTAGRRLERLTAGADALAARAADGGDAAFDFQPFPRVQLRLIWRAGDDEFPATATLLLPQNIESYFCCEDIVVLSENLVARLDGRPF